MKRIALTALLVVIISFASLLIVGGTSNIPTATNATPSEEAVVDLTNKSRSRHDLNHLQTNKKLERAARLHSRDMLRRGFFNHVSPDGTNVVDRVRPTGYLRKSWIVAENIARFPIAISSPLRVHKSWMQSPGHRHNILNPELSEIGVGIADDNKVKYYTVVFGNNSRKKAHKRV